MVGGAAAALRGGGGVAAGRRDARTSGKGQRRRRQRQDRQRWWRVRGLRLRRRAGGREVGAQGSYAEWFGMEGRRRLPGSEARGARTIHLL